MKTLTLLFLLSTLLSAAPFTEGELILKLTTGQHIETHRYRFKGQQLRIDRPGTIIPSPPINLIDLTTNQVTLLTPHNGIARKFTASNQAPKSQNFPSVPGIPQLPPGIGPQSNPALPQPETPPQSTQIGPDLSKLPGAVELLQLPQNAQLPDQENLPQTPPQQGGLPVGIPDPPAGIPMPPPVPQMPQFDTRSDNAFILKTTEETKELQGLPCTKYTLTVPREGQLTLWLTQEENLFPFHRLTSEKPGQFGRSEWPNQVAALLRSKKLFPILLTLHETPHSHESNTEPSPEILRWEVISVTNNTIDDKDKQLFTTPKSFHFLDY